MNASLSPNSRWNGRAIGGVTSSAAVLARRAAVARTGVAQPARTGAAHRLDTPGA